MGEHEAALRAAGVLAGPVGAGGYPKWLANAARHRVAPRDVVAIARQQRITPASFAVLDAMTEVNDPDHTSFFLVRPGTGSAELRTAALMTYVLNADTGYRTAGRRAGGDGTDFADTPYSAAEVRRIADRQRANGWSYRAARSVGNAGGSLVTTPNGMLMGIAGNRLHRRFGQRGGTAYGDLFLLNIGHSTDPAETLSRLVGNPDRDLDRLLHHEERHARQWARLGPVGMAAGYLAEEARVRIFGGVNRFERDAGLADGGYR